MGVRSKCRRDRKDGKPHDNDLHIVAKDVEYTYALNFNNTVIKL